LGEVVLKLWTGIIALCCAACAGAQSYGVVPNAYAGTSGTASFLYFQGSGRTYQYLINENQLTGFIGMNLTGLSWRLLGSASTSWPLVDAQFANFDIYIGPGVTPASRSTTFANNYTGSPTQVRSGALTLPTGSFPATGTPRDWGPVVSFSPFLYTGGHLTVEMRHSGMTGAANISFDANGTSAPGYLTDYAALWTGSYTPVTGGAGNFFITRFQASPVPEPATLLVVGAGVFFVRRRRK
jgi:hypothetical protein